MTVEDTTTVDDADSDADFGSGFSGKSAEKTPAKEAPAPAEVAREEVKPPVEYIQITAADWAVVSAAAAKTASYDQQLSKAWGTLGNLQKLVNGYQDKDKAKPAAEPRKFEISPKAFEAMEKDFPELAQQTRAALEAALSGIPGTGADVDASKIETMLAAYTAKREKEILEEDHPDWFSIVGGVDAAKGEKPDPNHPFRKWLSTKPEDYQNRITHTESPPVLSRAIRTFQRETKAAIPAAVKPRDDARADRIRSAVQPRGDNAGAAPGRTEEDDFAAGFNSR